MIKADLHMHTLYSHAKDTPAAMAEAAQKKGLTLIGFSEHSPRPSGFNYRHEYREKLTRHFMDYINEVNELKKAVSNDKDERAPAVLLGLEMDWLAGEEEFVRASCAAHDFDYLIGSVHFLDHWGFDDGDEPWRGASQEECEKRYKRYFELWLQMIQSGLFKIAAHPDLIKIFSVGQFHEWLKTEENRAQVMTGLLALKKAGMAMEISSAGLRKACREIYPCPQIMELAASLQMPISIASDAHRVEDVGADFDALEKYARSFGFNRLTWFDHGLSYEMPL